MSDTTTHTTTRTTLIANNTQTSVRRSARLKPPLTARTRSKRITVFDDHADAAAPSTPDTAAQKPKRRTSKARAEPQRQALGDMPMNTYTEPLRMGIGGKRKAMDGDERPMKMARRDLDSEAKRIRSPLKTKTSTPKKIAKFFSALTPGRKALNKHHGPTPTPARVLLSPKKQSLATPGPGAASTDVAGSTKGSVDMDGEEDDDEANDYVPRPPTPPRPHINSTTPAVAPTQIPNPHTVDHPRHSSPPRLKHITSTSPIQEDLFSPKRDAAPRAGVEEERRVIARLSFSPVKGSTPKLEIQQARASVNSERSRSAVPTVITQPAELDAADRLLNLEPSPPSPTKVSDPEQVTKPLTTQPASFSGLPLSRLPSISRLPRSSAPPGAAPRVSSEPTKAPVRGSMPPPSAFPGTRVISRGTTSIGRGFPSGPSSAPLPASTNSSDQTVRRKPSYPTSLGSGHPSRPPSYSSSSTTKSILKPSGGSEQISGLPPSSIPRLTIAPRTVSEPITRTPLADATRLAASTANVSTTREGISAETSESLAGLSNALNKLKTKRAVSISAPPRRPTSIILPSTSDFMPSDGHSEPSSRSTSVRIASIHRPRGTILDTNAGDESMMSNGDEAGDRSLAALMVSSEGRGCMKGVVAFVDVRTAEGDEAGVIFADILRSLGARVISRLTDNVTHVIYKSGRQTTLTWWRRQDLDDRPYIVGISWVTKSKEKGERLEEAAFTVNVDDEDVFQKRRKSMEPRMLSSGSGRHSVLGNADYALNIADLKRRSMINPTRVSSPLKKA